MGKAISGEDAVDRGNGRQWSDSLLLQYPGDGLSSIRESPIVEVEPFHYNDLFDFHRGIEVHRFLSRQQKDDVVIREDQVKIEISVLEPIIGDDLIYEKSEVIGDGKDGFAGITAYEIEGPLVVGLDSRLLAAGLEGVYLHDHVSPSLLSKMELLRTCCLRKFSSMVSTPWTAALMRAWIASWLMTLGRPLAR